MVCQIVYPQCLAVLDLLQLEEVRESLARGEAVALLEQQMLMAWGRPKELVLEGAADTEPLAVPQAVPGRVATGAGPGASKKWVVSSLKRPSRWGIGTVALRC